jgi:hypothetical protein
LSESFDKELGSKDLDIIMVKYLADKFNSLPERKGKENVLSNI